MLSKTVKVINPLGLHARAAANLVRLAAGFQSEINLKRTDNQVVADAKSILSILTLAAAQGTELEVEIVGTDEQQVMKEIESIFANGFGEI